MLVLLFPAKTLDYSKLYKDIKQTIPKFIESSVKNTGIEKAVKT